MAPKRTTKILRRVTLPGGATLLVGNFRPARVLRLCVVPRRTAR